MSKKPKGKNAFTSLYMNRVAEEEIKKYKNNAIHLSYSTTENNNPKYNQLSKKPNQTKYTNGSSDINFLQKSTYQSRNKNSSSNKKNKTYIETAEYRKNPQIKKNKSGIVINIYSRKNEIDKDNIIVNDDNYCFDNENDKQTERDEYEQSKYNKINELDAVGVVRNVWINSIKISNESNFDIFNVSNKNKINKIAKEINFNIISKNKWGKELRKENDYNFTIYKTSLKDKFMYTEENYIKDLSNSIFIPKDSKNDLYIINPPNNLKTLNNTKYKLIHPKDRNQLESQLLEYYNQNKNNYYTNIDNNDDIEEQKLRPIYVLSKPQICDIYNELKPKNKQVFEIVRNTMTISPQMVLDYDTIEVFTPRTNKDNNTNRTKYNNNNIYDSNYIHNDNSIKNNSQDFGQYTPISMLNEKFFIYAISRNIKYSIPENQGFINYLNYDKYVKKYYRNDLLQKNKFSLKITKININKKKNPNIIDYSKYSSGTDKNSKNK